MSRWEEGDRVDMTPATVLSNTDTVAHGPQWPGVVAMVTAWCMPAETAQRTQRVSLPAAYAVHILASLLTAVLIFLLIAWASARDANNLYQQASENWRDLMAVFIRHPFQAWLVTGIIVAVVEGCYFLMGLLAAPWGAADERLRSSVANGLRRTWLQTGHWLPIVLLAGLFFTWLVSEEQRFWRENSLSLAYPSPASMPAPGTPAYRQYQADIAKWQKEIEARRQRQPWYVRNTEQAFILTIDVMFGWFLWALLRGLGQPRVLAKVERPPTCEFCGYNLTLAAPDGRCPECGEWIADSLGPHARPGTPWHRRSELGRLRAWWQTCYMAIFRPRQLGQQIRAFGQDREDCSLLAINLFLVFLVEMLLGCGWVIIQGRWELPFFPRSSVLATGVASGAGATLLTVALVLFGALVVGVVQRWNTGRNMLPAAMRASVCLTGYVLVASVGVQLVASLILFNMIRTPFLYNSGLLGIGGIWRMPALSLLPWFALVGLFLLLLSKATSAARYANR